MSAACSTCVNYSPFGYYPVAELQEHENLLPWRSSRGINYLRCQHCSTLWEKVTTQCHRFLRPVSLKLLKDIAVVSSTSCE